MSKSEEDLEQINQTAKELYACICFSEGGYPEVDKLTDLMIPDGRMINNNGSDPLIMKADDFIQIYKDKLESGVIKAFYEGEISSKTELFGKVAHRFSTYEKKYDLEEKEPSSLGINSIQFIKVNNKWRISCIAWNEQTETLKIPENYL